MPRRNMKAHKVSFLKMYISHKSVMGYATFDAIVFVIGRYNIHFYYIPMRTTQSNLNITLMPQ